MHISGHITGIKYKVFLANELLVFNTNKFDINDVPAACIISTKQHSFAISKWVSPKRTRSYPCERVYNTLNISKKITVIPIVKDEGAAGDRDFLQWDTISLMSLLDVYVIFAYYNRAEKIKEKITNQQFHKRYILSKINEITQYHSSALHWNLNELNTNLHSVLNKVKSSYRSIERTTGVKLHAFSGIDNFKIKIGKDVSEFMRFSRDKAEKAQSRELLTVQPKERLGSLSKAKITITNYLGGEYFLTVDEVKSSNNKLQLIESKHSSKSLLPSVGDIKDGLLKMILFSNLTKTKVDGKNIECESVLSLTSNLLVGLLDSSSTGKKIETFIARNNFSMAQSTLVKTLFQEARCNNFMVVLKHAK